LKPGTVENYRHHIATVLESFPRRVREVSVSDVLMHRKERLAAGTSPGTINAELRSVSIMFNWGVDPARIIATNPLKGIKPIPNDNPKEGRALTGEEVAALLDASPAHRRDKWFAFLVTGCRRNELAQLRFDDIDWDARELIVRRGIAKNHSARRLPIDDELWDILKRLEAGREHRQPSTRQGEAGVAARERFTRDHVFVSKQNTPLAKQSLIYQTFRRHCRKAGVCIRADRPDGTIEHVDLHGLRRTFATALIVEGADPKTVQELVGHKTLAMTMNLYAKIHTGTKRQAVARLPWSRGVKAPDHVVEFPMRAQDGHVLSTVANPYAASG